MDRIVYAHPCKPPAQIKFAAAHGVNMTTFDTESELLKVSAWRACLGCACGMTRASLWQHSLCPALTPAIHYAFADGCTEQLNKIFCTCSCHAVVPAASAPAAHLNRLTFHKTPLPQVWPARSGAHADCGDTTGSVAAPGKLLHADTLTTPPSFDLGCSIRAVLIDSVRRWLPQAMPLLESLQPSHTVRKT